MAQAHAKRFIIEVRGDFSGGKWIRSLLVPEHFITREEAQVAVTHSLLQGQYRIRQK
jgi:hypothetical protein